MEVNNISTPTPADIVSAHQYLYYVRVAPIISDYEYDQYCRKHGIDGNGGSDRAGDYSGKIIGLADRMVSTGNPIPTEF